MSDIADAVARLRAEWGLDFARVRRVLAALSGGATLSELVAASGLPRRSVESVLTALAEYTTADGDRHHLPLPPALLTAATPASDRRSFVAPVGDIGTPVEESSAEGMAGPSALASDRRSFVAPVGDIGTPVEESSAEGMAGPSAPASDRRSFVAPVGDIGTPDGEMLTGRMAELAAGLPPSRWRLDHVPATPATMARRALYLAGEYELDGASVLCLGDHDLTSLAVGQVVPGAELTVVDIDEPVLDHIAASAGRLGLAVTSAWADLRLAFPPSLVGTADLVFTDPPYTVEGMRLFLTRALEALRPTGHERLAFCFGTGERHLVKALEVQSLLGDLRLALEAMLPGFNHYAGAEAIGARSDLYICRPTKGARVGEPPRPSRSKRQTSRIYTRGAASEESRPHPLPAPIAAAALAAAGDAPTVLIGEAWNNPTASAVAADAAVPLAEYFARLAAWVTAARPGPYPFPGTPVVNTYPDHGAAAVRALLLAAPERAVLVVPRRDLPDAALLAAAYDITPVPSGPGGDPAVLLVTRAERPPGNVAEAVLRHVLLHPGSKVVNAWRDALLASAREAGTPMTKNEARARIRADTLPPTLRRLRPWELPTSALGTLADEITRRTPDG